MCVLRSSRAIALVSFSISVFALSIPSQPSLAYPGTPQLPHSENGSALLLSSANVSTSASAFESNLSLNFLGPKGATNNAQPVCNEMFGTNLNVQSCVGALLSIQGATVPITFGDRGHGYDVQLPRRISSSDGTCVIDIFHKEGAIYDYSNRRQISEAASRVVFECVRPGNNYMGGYVRDVGISQNLAIVVSAYNPVVKCYGSIGSARTASQALIDMIPTTYNEQVFAPARIRSADVIVPRSYTQPQSTGLRGRFYVTIGTVRSKAVTGRWFDVWAAAVAINVLCVANGRAGKAVVRGGLVVKVDRTYVGPGEIVSETSNGSSVVVA